AEMATEIEAARQLVYDAVWKFDKGEYPVREISMAKLYTGLVVNRITNHAMQIFGGASYLMDVPIQRAWRDSRLMRIGGGADEVRREILSKMRGLGFEPRLPHHPDGAPIQLPRARPAADPS